MKIAEFSRQMMAPCLVLSIVSGGELVLPFQQLLWEEPSVSVIWTTIFLFSNFMAHTNENEQVLDYFKNPDSKMQLIKLATMQRWKDSIPWCLTFLFSIAYVFLLQLRLLD